MQYMKRATLSILSHLYIAGVRLRHWLFDRGILKSKCFEIPIICVGNITVGGTGKSPMSEMLLEKFTPNHRVAVLSRGYGRTSRGYLEVERDDDYLHVGDEPLQIKMKYPQATVVVCERRVEGVEKILVRHPDIELIIMDDGFQHRHIKPRLNIIMVDATRPISQDSPLPLGSLRDTPEALHRADYFVVTKCPRDISQEQIAKLRSELIVEPHQRVYFSKIVNLSPEATYPEIAPLFDPTKEIIALAGIGNPTPFLQTIKERYHLTQELIFRDHHSYTNADIESIAQLLNESPDTSIITTEKDSVKFLMNNDIPQIIKERLYYTPIRMSFIDEEPQQLLKEIEKLCKRE